MKNFYKRFQLISGFPLWPNYLRWVYEKTISDSTSVSITPLRKRKSFTCLLCGVSGEITANEYIKFVLSINPKARIIIIDIGKEQIGSLKKLISNNFSEANITVRQANALNLDFITDKSLDWIDTDGFFSFFDNKQLLELFKEWKRMLKNDGYITFRELISHGFISTIANKLRAYVAKMYMGIELHQHNTEELEHSIKQVGFKSKHGISPIPLLDRYCLIKIG